MICMFFSYASVPYLCYSPALPHFHPTARPTPDYLYGPRFVAENNN